MAGIASPTFNKRERIVRKKLIEQLFSKGSSFSVSAFPLRIVVMETARVADDIPVQVLVSVSNGTSNMRWTAIGSSVKCVRPIDTINRY